jgi:hypothetical protein
LVAAIVKGKTAGFQEMLFDTLSDYFERIALTSERLELYRLIAELLDRAGTAELPTIAYLFEARLAPAFAGVQMEMEK